MAEPSRLAKKQLAYLLRERNNVESENDILRYVIYYGFLHKGCFILCNGNTINILNTRFNELKISIIAVQTNLDDDIPLHTFIVEDFCANGSYQMRWTERALFSFFKKYSQVWLRFYFDLSDEEVQTLKILNGISLN